MDSEGAFSSAPFHQALSSKWKAGPVLKLLCHIFRYPGLFLLHLGLAKRGSDWWSGFVPNFNISQC